MSAASAFATSQTTAAPPTRAAGLLAIATGLAAFVLLALHPGDTARTFADVVKEEAANQAANALVHGGFIVVLALQMVCYVVFSARLGLSRVSTVAALVFFAMGAMFMCASLLIDGLVTPAVAARYAAKPDKIENARVLFVLMGAMVGFLLPMALAFQAAAIAAWGWAAAAVGSRGAGVAGLLLGGLMAAAVAGSFATGNPMLLLGALAASALWAVTVGIALMRGKTR